MVHHRDAPIPSLPPAVGRRGVHVPHPHGVIVRRADHELTPDRSRGIAVPPPTVAVVVERVRCLPPPGVVVGAERRDLDARHPVAVPAERDLGPPAPPRRRRRRAADVPHAHEAVVPPGDETLAVPHPRHAPDRPRGIPPPPPPPRRGGGVEGAQSRAATRVAHFHPPPLGPDRDEPRIGPVGRAARELAPGGYVPVGRDVVEIVVVVDVLVVVVFVRGDGLLLLLPLAAEEVHVTVVVVVILPSVPVVATAPSRGRGTERARQRRPPPVPRTGRAVQPHPRTAAHRESPRSPRASETQIGNHARGPPESRAEFDAGVSILGCRASRREADVPAWSEAVFPQVPFAVAGMGLDAASPPSSSSSSSSSGGAVVGDGEEGGRRRQDRSRRRGLVMTEVRGRLEGRHDITVLAVYLSALAHLLLYIMYRLSPLPFV